MGTRLTKICSRCGQEKPFYAFIQITGPHGTTYGSICSTCRKKPENKAKEVEEGTRRETGGSKIHALERLNSEAEKKKLREKEKQEKKLEQKKDEKLKTEKLEKTTQIEKKERDHREQKSIFDRGTLLTPPKKETKQSSTEIISRGIVEKQSLDTFNVEETTKQEESSKSEQKESATDFRNLADEFRVAGQLRRGENYRRFMQWVKGGEKSSATSGPQQKEQKESQDKSTAPTPNPNPKKWR